MPNKRKVLIILLLAVLFTAIGFMIGTACAPNEREIKLSVVEDRDTHFTEFSNEDLGGNYEPGITYFGLSEVTVTINGKDYDLIDAIASGVVTVEEIIGQAMLDAKDFSTCRLRYSTDDDYGITTYIYQYNTFDLLVRYDVLEYNGEEYHIEGFDITYFDNGRSIYYGYSDITGDYVVED